MTLLLILLVGCDEDFVAPTGVPRLVVRDWFPQNDAQVGRDQPIGASVTFNRSLSSLAEIRMVLIPEAESGSLTLSPSRRNVTWRDVEPALTSPLQYVLVDGVAMRAPFVLYWRADEDAVSAVASGVVKSTEPVKHPACTAVVFAMHTSGEFNPIDLRSFTQAQPSCVAVGLEVPNDSDSPVSLPLPGGSGSYHVIGIQDTNGDLIYDPTEDWYGIYRDRTGQALTVNPGQTGFVVELSPP